MTKLEPKESRARPSRLGAIVQLAAPVALAQLCSLSMQIVDTLFVGRLGAEALGAISIGNAVFGTVLVTSLGMLLGLDFLVARALGQGDLKESHSYLIQGLALATFFAVPLAALTIFGAGVLQKAGLPPAVAKEGVKYLRVLSLSLWPLGLFTAIRQYLQAYGKPVPALVILIVANVLNIVGNQIFIFGLSWPSAGLLGSGVPAMGVVGSAWSTLISRLFMLAMIATYALYRDRLHGLGLWAAIRESRLLPSRTHLSELARLGGPAAGQTLLEVGVFATSTLLIGRLGAVPLAAHHIVLQIASLTFMLPLGLSSASAVLVARAYGARRIEEAIRTGWSSIVFGACVMACVGVGLYCLRIPILGAFTRDPSVIRLGATLLMITALFQISDSLQVVTTGVLRGVGDTRTSLVANLFGHWGIGLPLGATLCFAYGWGAPGLWTGLSAGLTLVGVSLVGAWAYRAKSLARVTTPLPRPARSPD